jgi:hypothetical protein
MSAAFVRWTVEKDLISAVDIFHALATDSSEPGANWDMTAKRKDSAEISWFTVLF